MSTVALSLLHTRYQFIETRRIVIAMVGNLVFPGMALLFFVVPNSQIADDPVISTQAVGQMSVFVLMMSFLMSVGIGVAEDRAHPWDRYVRTLPVGAVPRVAARLGNGMIMMLLGLIPVIVIGALLTAAAPAPARVPLGIVTLLLTGMPFMLGAIAIGYALPSKAAIAVSQTLGFVLAFAGGLFLPASMFPTWLNHISMVLPSRAVGESVTWALTGTGGGPGYLLSAAAWTLATAALAIWSYRRDEGLRYR